MECGSEKFKLLDERLLGIEDSGGARHRVTLPGLLARLASGEPTELTRIQAHQQHAWHAFIVQLAALSLVRAGLADLPSANEATWRKLLLDCARQDGAGAEAFALVVPDLKKPAFMQPPVPEGRLAVLKNEHTTPSAELDVLVTSKNHDVKVESISAPSPEHWVFALVTLQTMQGFLGAGNYGIARMNGGFSSRPCVAYAPDLGSAARFCRDVRALLAGRDSMRELGFGTKGSLGLVWCAPWDGTKSLAVTALDPFFIEVCRRVRLSRSDAGAIVAHRGSSKVARIMSKDLQGNTADPWTPVSRQDGSAVTLSEAGFPYDRVQDFLVGDAWKHGAAGVPRGGKNGDEVWLGQVLVRGQGKTGGFHERCIPVPPRTMRFLVDESARAKLGRRAKAWVALARDARLRVLKPAVLRFLQGDPEKLKFDDSRADRTLRRFDMAVDAKFFETLFEHVESPPELADDAFKRTLRRLAKRELEEAFRSAPTSVARRERAIARAEREFRWTAKKCLPLLPRPQESEVVSRKGEGNG